MTKLFGATAKVTAVSLNQADYVGTTGPDTYAGGDAADSLQGNDGDDSLSGANGDDVVLGNAGNDSLFGDAGNDFVAGGAGDDLLKGGEGNDTLWSEAGLDTIDGGAGDDVVFWFRSDNAAAVNGGDGMDTLHYVSGTISGTLTGFEILDSEWFQLQTTTGFLNGFTKLLGHDFVLTDGGSINVSYRTDYMRVSATGAAVNIVGSAGQNSLSGSAGNDTLIGGAIFDELRGNTGNDSLVGGAGSDALYDDNNVDAAGNDTLMGGSGSDYLYSLGGADLIDGGTGSDNLVLSRLNTTAGLALAVAQTATASGVTLADGTVIRSIESVTIWSGSGNDTLTGGAGNDGLEGRDGDDLLNGRAGHDYLYGGNGNDTVISGGGRNDYDGKGDLVSGDAGDDLVIATGQEWSLNGGEGQDTLSFADAAAGVIISMSGWQTNAYSFERVTGTAYGDSFRGNASNNWIDGGDGDDFITGQDDNTYIFGTDTLYGGAGNDTVYAGATGYVDLGAGDDYLSVNGALDNVVIVGGDGTDKLVASYNLGTGAITGFEILEAYGEFIATAAQLNSFQSIVAGSWGLSIRLSGVGSVDFSSKLSQGVNMFASNEGNGITGSAYGEQISGGTGNDTLNGGGGNDYFYNGGGKDVLNGGAGDDTSVIYGTEDHLIFDGGDGTDLVYLAGYGSGSSLGNATFVNVENLYISNSEFSATVAQYNAFQSISSPYYGLRITDGGTIDFSTRLSQATTLYASAQGNNITGTDFREAIFGGAGDDTLNGGGGNDDLVASTGRDELNGGAGDDRLYVSEAGFVIVNGGEGTDTVEAGYYALTLGNGSFTNVEILRLDGYGKSATIAQLNSFSSIESASYGVVNLTLADSGAVDFTNKISVNTYLTASAGGNAIIGTAYSDNIFGKLAADTLSGGEGEDSIIGDAGDDVLHGGLGSDSLDGGTENDTLNGGDGLDNLAGDVGNDSLYGANHSDTLYGGHGNDTMDGAAGDDFMAGDWGNDVYYVDSVADQVWDSSDVGIDTIYASVTYSMAGSQVENLILTGTADLNGTGNSLANSLTGNAGKNLLDGGTGADTLAGGAGDDTYVVNLTTDVVTEAAAEGTDLVRASASYALSDHVEMLELTGTANINGTGNGLGNTLTGNSGNNALDGGAGIDAMTGGKGNDTYYVDNTGDNVVELTNEGTDSVFTSVTYSLVGRAVENLSLTGTAHLGATGNELANRLTGNDGNNLLDGGAGNDSLVGGLGHDTYIVNAVGDAVTEAADAGTDLVRASVTYTLGTTVENLELTGTANLNGTGNALNNTLTGNSGNNVLNGRAGADRMIGGLGDDVYYVDNVGDNVQEQHLQGTDTIIATVSYSLFGRAVEVLTLTGSGDLNATGNGLNNTITGTSGHNLLDGGAGADKLVGGLGDDTYYVDNVGDNVAEQHLQGTDTVFSSVTYSLLGRAVEIMTLTGSAHINATGNSLNNSLTGNSGNNRLDGGVGNDTLTGGLGADVFVFLSGTWKDTITDFSTTQNDSIDIHTVTNGIANTAMVTQVGANVLINLGGGNTVTVLNATQADVLSHMVW